MTTIDPGTLAALLGAVSDIQYEREAGAAMAVRDQAERAATAIERGAAGRDTHRRAAARVKVAEAKAEQKRREVLAERQEETPPPSTPLEDVYQPVEPNAASATPGQVPIAALGAAGGPQGIQEARGGSRLGVSPLMATFQRSRQTGPEEVITGVRLPVTRTTDTIRIEPNVVTADRALAERMGFLQAAMKSGVEQQDKEAQRIAQAMLGGLAYEPLAELGRAMFDAAPQEVQARALQHFAAFQGKTLSGSGRTRVAGAGGEGVELYPGWMVPPGTQGPKPADRSTNIYMPGEPTVTVTGRLQANLMEAQQGLEATRSLRATAREDQLTYPGKVAYFLADFKSRLGAWGYELTEDEERIVREGAAMRSNAGLLQVLTTFIFSGKAMTQYEQELFKSDILPSMMRSPVAFNTALDTVERFWKNAIMRNAYFLHGGFGDEQIQRLLQEPALSADDLYRAGALNIFHTNYWQGKMAARQRQLQDSGMSEREAKAQAVADFGLMGLE